MYLRFTTQFINPYGELETGIFMALKYLRDDYPLTSDDHISQLKELSSWFNKNLKEPTRLSKGTSKHNEHISLSWFKDSAKEHIKKMQDFVKIAEQYDMAIERMVSKNPGYVVFEDEYQVLLYLLRLNVRRLYN